MKSYIIILSAVIISAFNTSAMSLKEAFNALSNLQYVSISVDEKPSTIIIDQKVDSIGPLKIASAYNLDAARIFETGTAACAILNQVPMSQMIVGANNEDVAAFVYATQAEVDKYDLLVVVMSGYHGDIKITYTTESEATVNAFQQSKVYMQGAELEILPDYSQGGSAFRIFVGGHEEQK